MNLDLFCTTPISAGVSLNFSLQYFTKKEYWSTSNHSKASFKKHGVKTALLSFHVRTKEVYGGTRGLADGFIKTQNITVRQIKHRTPALHVTSKLKTFFLFLYSCKHTIDLNVTWWMWWMYHWTGCQVGRKGLNPVIHSNTSVPKLQ